MSSRAELVAAALERWETFKSDWPHTKPGDNAFDIGDALARLLRESQPVCPDCGGSGGVEYDTHLHLPCACSQPEPAPVVGDDEALLAVLDAAASHLTRTQDFELAQGVQAAATRHRAALADVARLTEERDSARASFYGNAEKAAQWFDELRQARATLAAVRKVAENYHDVDQVGDPPRWKACNPCAAEILNVLDGRAWPR